MKEGGNTDYSLYTKKVPILLILYSSGIVFKFRCNNRLSKLGIKYLMPNLKRYYDFAKVQIKLISY